MPHAFDNHISAGTNPCINELIHMLLMHRFDTLNILNTILVNSLTILVNSLTTSVICSYPLQTNWTQIRPDKTLGLIWILSWYSWKNFSKKLILQKIKAWKKFPGGKELNSDIQMGARGEARGFIMLKPTLRDIWPTYFTFQMANNKGADQTEWMRRLICAFVVHKQQSQGFSRRGPYDVEAQAFWPPPWLRAWVQHEVTILEFFKEHLSKS